MTVRNIVRIDESKCDGCGLCVPRCAEGALAIVDGKARLVRESYCDGLGACLGECPRGAITIEPREAEPFDAAAAGRHAEARATGPASLAGCPGAQAMRLAAAGGPPQRSAAGPSAGGDAEGRTSALGHWPIQLALLPVEAPFYEDAELVLAADCAAYAVADFHARFLKGRALAICCPKLDDVAPYVEKLAAILGRNAIRGLVLVHMEVPCCGGIVRLAHEAARRSGRVLPVRDVTAGLRGEILGEALTLAGERGLTPPGEAAGPGAGPAGPG